MAKLMTLIAYSLQHTCIEYDKLEISDKDLVRPIETLALKHTSERKNLYETKTLQLWLQRSSNSTLCYTCPCISIFQ